MEYQRTAAIILKSIDHGESDKIVTLFCRGLGRLSGIAKGAKRSKKRFVNKLEIFSSLEINHSHPDGDRLTFIAAADLVDGFPFLRSDIAAYATGSTICEIILTATRDLEGDDHLYPLLLWALSSLNNRHNPKSTLIIFMIRLFKIIGYEPILDKCTGCNCGLDKNNAWSYHPARGGIQCGPCSGRTDKHTIRMTPGTLKSLKAAYRQPLDQIHRLHLSQTSQAEALYYLHSYFQNLFQRELISWQFLNITQM